MVFYQTKNKNIENKRNYGGAHTLESPFPKNSQFSLFRLYLVQEEVHPVSASMRSENLPKKIKSEKEHKNEQSI